MPLTPPLFRAGRSLRWAFPNVLAAGMLFPFLLHAQADSVKPAVQAATAWTNVRAESTRIEAEWKSQQPLLASMVDQLADRAKRLEAKQEFLEAKTAKDREEIANLEATNRASAVGLQAVIAQLRTVDAQLFQLRPTLPPRLSEALALVYKSLGESDLPVNDRMQQTIMILNRCTQF